MAGNRYYVSDVDCKAMKNCFLFQERVVCLRKGTVVNILHKGLQIRGISSAVDKSTMQLLLSSSLVPAPQTSVQSSTVDTKVRCIGYSTAPVCLNGTFYVETQEPIRNLDCMDHGALACVYIFFMYSERENKFPAQIYIVKLIT